MRQSFKKAQQGTEGAPSHLPAGPDDGGRDTVQLQDVQERLRLGLAAEKTRARSHGSDAVQLRNVWQVLLLQSHVRLPPADPLGGEAVCMRGVREEVHHPSGSEVAQAAALWRETLSMRTVQQGLQDLHQLPQALADPHWGEAVRV